MANGSRRALLGLVGSTVAVILIAWTGRAHLASLLDKEQVEGSLRLKRIAKYDDKDGTWSGVAPVPSEPPAAISAVEKAVAASIMAAMTPFATGEKAVAASIMAAMTPFATGEAIPKEHHVNLPAGWYDPTDENIRSITSATGNP
ncbi:hypothetical protein T484DRAFT_1853508 [Baffinella frigidus]|nr:hypothetical protein T484DRAFT_1853508 [Cryptophyta sp. CCMP2293]